MYNNEVSGDGFSYPIERALNKGFNWKLWKTRRFVVTFMGLWGFFNLYTVRASLSVAMVEMTQIVKVVLENGTVVQQQEFQWDSRQKGMALGSFFYGYIWTQMLGGVLATRFGGNIVFGYAPGISYILNLLSPAAAKLGLYPLVVVRFLMGLLQGVSFPSIQEVYSNWAPEYEKTRMAGIVQSGNQIGAFTSFLLSGFLVEYFGWESVLYFFGGIGCLWFLLWAIYIKRNPANDPRISAEERAYIESSLAGKNLREDTKIPWKLLLTSKAVWAQAILTIADGFFTFTYMTEMPAYLKDVLNFNLGTSGFLAAMPFLLFIILTPIASSLGDFLRSRKILSTINVRKLFTGIGLLCSCACLLIMCNSTTTTTVMICLIISVGVTTFTKISYFTNPLDFAPAYASVVMGFSNTLGVIPGILAPTIVGLVVRNGTYDEWQLVFYIICGFFLIGLIIFGFFGQGEIQEWAKGKTRSSNACTEPLQQEMESRQ